MKIFICCTFIVYWFAVIGISITLSENKKTVAKAYALPTPTTTATPNQNDIIEVGRAALMPAIEWTRCDYHASLTGRRRAKGTKIDPFLYSAIPYAKLKRDAVGRVHVCTFIDPKKYQ